MNNLTYLECITHIRKYKSLFKLEAIAKAININADQFRQIVSQRQYAKELPEKYRTEFIRVVSEFCRVEQETPEEKELSHLFEPMGFNRNLPFDY